MTQSRTQIGTVGDHQIDASPPSSEQQAVSASSAVPTPQAVTVQPDQVPMPSATPHMDWLAIGGLTVAALTLWVLFNQLKQSRLSTERQLRAYLAVRPLGVVKLIGSDRMLGQVLLKNVGSTLARNVSLEVHAAIEPGSRDRTDFPVGTDPMHMPRGLQPGDEMPQGSKNSLLLSDVQASDDFIFIWGIAHYDDGFGRRRFTRFCHRYSCASHDRDAFRKASQKGVREALTIIDPSKARLNEIGNDAD